MIITLKKKKKKKILMWIINIIDFAAKTAAVTYSASNLWTYPAVQMIP